MVKPTETERNRTKPKDRIADFSQYIAAFMHNIIRLVLVSLSFYIQLHFSSYHK
jgi:hypothetical protein